jgi:hypothetical protein
MKLPGLDEITSIVRDLPGKTEQILGHLARIEALLERLVEQNER